MIETLAFSISGIGIALLLILALRIMKVDSELKLNKHRSKAAGFADLLNYSAVVDDGVIVCKSGAFMAAWIYQGSDNASSTNEQREQISFYLNQAFSGMGNGWMVHVDAVRREAPNYSDRSRSSFPDPISQAIDEERRQLFEGLDTMYEGYFVLTVTWFPPMLAQKKFIELMFDDDSEALSKTKRTHSLIKQFKQEVSNIENRLSAAVSLTRLQGQTVKTEDGAVTTYDDFLAWLQFCITGTSQPMVLPSNPMYLDAYLGGQELYGGVVPKLGRKFVQVVAIEGFPLESHPGVLTALAELPIQYRWSSRFIFMDQHEAIKHLDKFRKKWKQKVRGFFDQVFNTNSSSVDHDAVSMVEDAEAAIAEVSSGLIAQGYYTSVIVLMSEDRTQLEGYARQVEKTINKLGFAARTETINTLDAYMGSLPGHAVENVRRPLINTMNLADLLPTSTVWTGEEDAPCPLYPPHSPALMHCVTNGSTPFRLNMHVRDLGHTFVFGPTGAGKSTLLGLIAAQLRRYEGMNIYAFDKGMSMYPLTKAVGGRHFTIASDDDRLAFCPLQYLDSRADRAWAMEWIVTILKLNGVDVTPGRQNEIGYAIQSMYESGARTLSEFVITIQDESVREALRQYTVDGAMGHLLDAEEDGLSLTDFTTFEIEELMDLDDRYALPVLLYLFRRIEKGLKGQPAVIILDEAWLMLGHEVFREKIKEWLKVLRKANCLVLMATQSLTDAANSGILDVIVESTATKIFLPNLYAKDEDTADLYRRMGLNDRQIDIIASAVQKRHYYYTSERGRRLFELALGNLALAFVGASDKDSIEVIKQLEDRYGDAWVDYWLESRGVHLDNYLEAA